MFTRSKSKAASSSSLPSKNKTSENNNKKKRERDDVRDNQDDINAYRESVQIIQSELPKPYIQQYRQQQQQQQQQPTYLPTYPSYNTYHGQGLFFIPNEESLRMFLKAAGQPLDFTSTSISTSVQVPKTPDAPRKVTKSRREYLATLFNGDNDDDDNY